MSTAKSLNSPKFLPYFIFYDRSGDYNSCGQAIFQLNAKYY